VLKRAVLHRKNALFYGTLNGAEVGDLFMSLIHTCQLNGVNSFQYLTELQRHAAQMAANPSEWSRGTTGRRWCGPLVYDDDSHLTIRSLAKVGGSLENGRKAPPAPSGEPTCAVLAARQ
jgi:hypothetical protein